MYVRIEPLTFIGGVLGGLVAGVFSLAVLWWQQVHRLRAAEARCRSRH